MRAYFFSLSLLVSLILGGLFGFFCEALSVKLKPLGDLFLNLILTAIVPLIFFSVALAIARLGSWKRLAGLILKILAVFLGMGLIAAVLAYIFIQALALPSPNLKLISSSPVILPETYHGWQDILSVSQFFELMSHQHMLALLIFSGLIGMAISQTQGKALKFLEEGEKIFMQVLAYIMRLAPFGFFAYFANIVHDLGPQIAHNYGKITLAYYIFSGLYLVFGFSAFIFFIFGQNVLKNYWRAIILPASTALATCSSAATIPANLLACRDLKLKPFIYEAVIPFGTMIHKQGSIIGGMFKIAFMYSILDMNFHGFMVMSSALGISILVGSVMGAIPSGGLLGELLILSAYGLPSSALMMMSAISILIDPIATMLNTCGNLVATMIVDKLIRSN